LSIPKLIRSYTCSADVAAKRIVKFSDAASTSKVAQAAANTDPLWGVSDAMGGKSGGLVDVIVSGLAEVQLGGSVNAGDPITSDGSGKGVACAGAAGETRRIVGYAEAPGVAGDIIQIVVDRGVLQLPA